MMLELSAKDPKCCEITSKAVMRPKHAGFFANYAFCGINLWGKQNLSVISAHP
jgi:hypothetical protein